MASNVLERIRQQVNAANQGNAQVNPDSTAQVTSQPAANVGNGQIAMPGSAPKRMASSYLS